MTVDPNQQRQQQPAQQQPAAGQKPAAAGPGIVADGQQAPAAGGAQPQGNAATPGINGQQQKPVLSEKEKQEILTIPKKGQIAMQNTGASTPQEAIDAILKNPKLKDNVMKALGRGAQGFATGVASRLIERAGAGMDEATGGATNVQGSIQAQAQRARTAQASAPTAGAGGQQAAPTGEAGAAGEQAQDQSVQQTGESATAPEASQIPQDIMEALKRPEVLEKVKALIASLPKPDPSQAKTPDISGQPRAQGGAGALGNAQQGSPPPLAGPGITEDKKNPPSDANLKQVFMEKDCDCSRNDDLDFTDDDIDIPMYIGSGRR